MDEPLVSIIMGVYNAETRVSDCIESVLNQTYKNWEFVICDDCSEDNTYQILKKYQQSDNRIKIIHNKKNMRLAASLNHCLKNVSGIYVARMDDDDIALPERVKKQVDFLNEHLDYDVVGTNAKIFDGKKITGIRHCKEFPTEKDVLMGPPYIHPTIMMRKKVYDQLNGYTVEEKTRRGEDWDLWFRFYAAGFKGYNIQEELLIYHESSDDYKKRTLKIAFLNTKIAISGYRKLGVPVLGYIYAFKPILSYFIPEKIKKIVRHESI